MASCPHGSWYDAGCRCDHCVTLHHRYNAVSRRRASQRQWGKQFPSDRLDPTYAHKVVCDAYSVRGMSFASIALTCGLNQKTIRNLYYGKSRYVTRGVEDRIRESLDTEWINIHRKPTSRVDAAPYRDWVLRLMAQGWTTLGLIEVLEKNSNHSTGWVWNVTKTDGKRYFLYWRSAQACMWLVDFIGDKRGPSQQTATLMMNRGIFPTIHYTESGELIEQSLLPDQRRILRGLRSKHGKSSSRGHGS